MNYLPQIRLKLKERYEEATGKGEVKILRQHTLSAYLSMLSRKPITRTRLLAR